MPNVFYNRVIETSSNTPTNSGTVTVSLSGTSPTMTFIGGGTTVGRTFVSVLSNSSKCVVHIFQTNNPALWCEVEVTFSTGSPSNLTFVAGNVLDGSSGVGSLVTFTGTVTCELTVGMRDHYHNYLSNRGYIRHGSWLTYNSGTAVNWNDLQLSINGIIRNISSGTVTSGSTMQDLAGSTVTLGSSSMYMAFATSAGNVRFENYDGTGDGAAPVWSTDLDYWYAASTGTSARLFGILWTSGASTLQPFAYDSTGRLCTMHVRNGAVALVTTGSATSFTSVTKTPFIQDFVDAYYLGLRREISSGSNVSTFTAVSIDTTNIFEFSQGLVSASGASTLETRVRIPNNTTTLHYQVAGTNARGTIFLAGAEMTI